MSTPSKTPVEQREHWRTEAIPFATLTAVATQQLFSGLCAFVGFALLETTGAAAADIEIFDGADAGGTSLAPISLSSGQSIRDFFGLDGPICSQGIAVKVSVGSVRGSIYIKRPL